MTRQLILKDFQKEDVLFMRKHNYNVLVANAPGTGKTIEALAAIGIERKKLLPAIIICPASVVGNWQREAEKWCWWASIHVIKNQKTPIPRRLKDIYIISWSLITERALDLLSIRPKLLIADEAHYAKNDEAARSQVVYGIALRTPHRLLLTGTPLVNSETEFQNLKSLFPGGNPPIIRRLLENACPEIPPKSRCLLPIELPRKFRKEYNRAEAHFSRWLEDQLRLKFDDQEAEAAHRRALAAEALVKVGYLRRIVGRGKTNAAVDWAARAVRVGEPVVIFAEHQDVIKRMSHSMRRQRLRHVILVGSTPKRQRQGLIDEFQEGKVPIFIGSKAASTGINLFRARHLLFCERFWTSAEEEQAEDRIRRIGQKYPTKAWALHAIDTIDDRIVRVIERKRRLIHKHIGLEDIEDTPEKTVLAMINSWSATADAPLCTTVTSLGIAKSLPPLPSPNKTLQVLFSGPRWNKASVKAWAHMNGYILRRIKHDGRCFRGTVRSPTDFKKGSFQTYPVSKEIKIVIGTRLDKKRGRPKGRRRRSA